MGRPLRTLYESPEFRRTCLCFRQSYYQRHCILGRERGAPSPSVERNQTLYARKSIRPKAVP